MSSAPSQSTNRMRQWLAVMPIPLLLAVIAVLWAANPQTVCESRLLMVLLNFFFTWLASLCVCVLTARGFLAGGQPGLLMFGCGSLVWGVTSLAAAAIVDRINPTVTVHNLGVLAVAICHFAGLQWRGRLLRPGRWLAAGYAGALLVALLIFAAATAGWTPVFFVQNHGGTAVRQVALISATVLFAWSGWKLFAKSRRQPGTFYYWYGLGLGLVATGLAGLTLLTVQGGIMGWANRLTQYLGSAYLLVAAVSAARETGAWKLSFSSMEEAWRKGDFALGLGNSSSKKILLRYGFVIAAVGFGLGLRSLLEECYGPGLPTYITFYPMVMIAALLCGFGPGFAATVLVGFSSAYWILPPVGQFAIASPVDRLGLVLFTFMGVFISVVAELYSRSRQRAAAYERELAVRDSREALRRQAELIDPARAEVIAREMERVVRERGRSDAVPAEQEGAILRRVPALAGVTVAALGGLVLVGWVFGMVSLKSIASGFVSMKANTGLCFLLAGAALVLRERRAWRMTCAGIVGVVALITLAEYLTGRASGIDQLVFSDSRDAHTVYPGRMAEATALAFLFSSAALLMLKTRRGLWAQQALALAAGLLGLVAFLGYMYGVQTLYRFAGNSSMALHTAAGLGILASGLVLARTDGLGRILSGPGPGSNLARRFLPVALLLPVIISWLYEVGAQLGIWGPKTGAGLLALGMMLSLAAAVWWIALALNRADAARRSIEDQLRHQSELMDHANEALIVRELGGVIRFWNRGAAALYGWPAAEALGMRTFELLRTEGVPVPEKDAQLKRTGHWEGELTHVARDGRRVVVESRQTATHGADGRLLVLESDRDITERKQEAEKIRRLNESLEERVRQRTAELEEANRELDAFCYSVAHDLRAPLRNIDGFSLAVLQDYGGKLDAAGQGYLEYVRNGCQQMGHLIDELLKLSRMTRAPVRHEPVDLTALARRIANDLQQTAAGRVAHFRIADALMTTGDPHLIEAALRNLIENAWKFTGTQAETVIEVGATDGAGIAADGAPDRVFFVRDNGAGFDMKYADKLFAPFQRLHSRTDFPGTGIGLATVHRIIQRHGGRIWAEAAVGRGATFYFILPAGE